MDTPDQRTVCGTDVQQENRWALIRTNQRGRFDDGGPSGRHDFDLTPEAVRQSVAGVVPEPIHEHYVVVAGRRYPPNRC